MNRKLEVLSLIVILFLFGMAGSVFAQAKVDTVWGWEGPLRVKYVPPQYGYYARDTGYAEVSDNHTQGEKSIMFFFCPDSSDTGAYVPQAASCYKKAFSIPTPETLIFDYYHDSLTSFYLTSWVVIVSGDSVWESSTVYDFYPYNQWHTKVIELYSVPAYIDTIDTLRFQYWLGDFPCAGSSILYIDNLRAITNGDTFLVDAMGEPTGVEESISADPEREGLINFPNPFWQKITFVFSLSQAQRVRISVYDITGRTVATLLDQEKEKGKHLIVWNAKDQSNKTVPPGIYFYQMVCEKTTYSGKIILLK